MFAGTFLAVRALCQPGRYASKCPLHGMHPLLSSEGPDLEEFLRVLSETELQKMMAAHLITFDGQEFQVGIKLF